MKDEQSANLDPISELWEENEILRTRLRQLQNDYSLAREDYESTTRISLDTLGDLSRKNEELESLQKQLEQLDLSKIEAGKLKFEVIDFDLRTTIEDVTELLAERAQAKGLELINLIRHDVPMALRGDPGRLRQILLNLISNAIKFTQRGEVVVRVSLVEDHEESIGLRFEVADTGIGIDPQISHRLFAPFTQADGSTTRKYGGTGLGLAICKTLCELMNGRIGVDSVLGRGSTFWFTVQLAKQKSAPAADPLAADLSGIRALIVDDNDTNRKSLMHQAASWGMQPACAESAAQGLEMMRTADADGSPYQVAILDYHMPEMDGMELARRIKADPALCPVQLVILTALGERGQGAEAHQIGVAAYLTKPVRYQQLYECLGMVLGRGNAPSAPLITRYTLAENHTQARLPILLAEDNMINQKVVVLMLKKLGYRVDVAADGGEALSAIGKVNYHLVLMDCQMPEVDGFEATLAIRQLEKGSGRFTPIIALTANAMQGDRERCLACGMDDFLSKPVRLDDLARILEKYSPLLKNSAAPAAPAEFAAPPTPAAPDPLRPVIDKAVFDELMALLADDGPQSIVQLLEQFLQESDANLREISQGIEERNGPMVRMTAHKLKGMCANLGARPMAALCQEVEYLGRDAVFEALGAKYMQLGGEAERLSQFLKLKIAAL